VTKPGLYLLSVELSDGYAPPSIYIMKVFVLAIPKPIIKPNITNSKLKLSIGEGGFELQKV